MKKNIFIIAIFLGIVSWGCSKIESGLNLKQSMEKSVADINTAITKISESKGYQLLTASSDPAKSDDGFNYNIDLELVAGIYDFQPDPVFRFYPYHPYRLFKKTGESDMMIVNLPERMIFHPKYLHNCNPATDPVLDNNLTITASDYHLYYNSWNSYDYLLNAGLTLNDEDMGSLEVTSTSQSFKNHTSSSKYTFTEGYSISTSWGTGETGESTESSFALSKDDEILLKETKIVTWNDDNTREKQYILTIGNVDIKRTTGVDVIEVYVDGVLQQEAAAVITDGDDENGSICHKRDILLTYDDGTTVKLSELIGPVRTTLRTLLDSLHEMHFAKHIVDFIALDIYFNSL
jgi:hypothetical protein